MNCLANIPQTLYFALMTSILFFIGCDEQEEKVSISDVPDVVISAAQSAVEGFELEEAEIEESKDGIVYELEGTADGKAYEIEITPEGKIIEVELEDDKDDEEDEDDHENGEHENDG